MSNPILQIANMIGKASPGEVLKSIKEHLEKRKLLYIEHRVCMRCEGDLPENNTTHNPLTGETRQSALCPDCRKIVVAEMKKRFNLGG